MDEEVCAQCDSDTPRDVELTDLDGGDMGEKTTEEYTCANCGATGVVTYTPPDTMYTLDGELFGE